MTLQGHTITPLYRIDWCGLALALGLGLGVYLVASFCLMVPRAPDGHVLFWYVGGLPFAALLRTRGNRWPALIAASVAAIVAACLQHGEGVAETALRTLTTTAQFGFAAWILRRKLGPYLDLTSPRHLLWIAAVTAGTAAILVLARAPIALTLGEPLPFSASRALLWYLMTSLSLLVLGFPLLSLTSAVPASTARMDRRRIAVLGLLLTAMTGILAAIFGPPNLPAGSALMPLLMLIAWLYGLPGAGLANLIITATVGAFTYQRLADAVFVKAGLSTFGSGVYLAVFFCMCQLISLPLAIARARQVKLTEDLAAALAASERREQAAIQSEAEAVQARERLRGVIEMSTDVICTLDPQGHFVEVSENCEALWAISREALLGRSFLDLIIPEDRGKAMQGYDKKTRRLVKHSIRTNHPLPDGSVMPMSWAATWSADEHVYHCVGRDMSEYNAMEARFHQAQRMEAIGQLTGGVAHDFNNLLTVVLGSCEAVALELDDTRLQRQLEMALQAGEKCAELTRQLLAFARRQTLTPQAFDLNERLASAAPLIMRTLGSDLEFSIRTEGDLRRAFADPLQTETAILNLCLNARDAMPNGGKLLIETANATLTESYVKRHPDALAGEYVLITISDTGTGIPPEIIERIFDPFFTTKDVGSGTGLGLSMVHGFVNQSNGHIKVTSKPGRGTRFHLYLPAADQSVQEPAAPEPAEDNEPMRHGRENVLLVEDHPLVREHLAKKLRSLGYHVVVAANAAEALAVLARRDDFDLLLTDVVMPGGTSGLQLGQIAGERWPHIRILYTSGYAPDTLTGGGRLLDHGALLSKPYTKSQLAAKVRAVLDGACEPVA